MTSCILHFCVGVFEERLQDEEDCENCCFFHSRSSARADCLLALTWSTAGRPQGLLAGSPRVGETGRWPAVVTMTMAASICQGGDCQFRLVLEVSVFCHCAPKKLVLDQRLVVLSCGSLHTRLV